MTSWRILIPEVAEAMVIPSVSNGVELSAQEVVSIVRNQNFVSSAYPYSVDGGTITFTRPVGGTKGA